MADPTPPTIEEILASHRDTIAPGGILDLNPLSRTGLDRLDGTAQAPALTKQAWREIQFRLARGASPAASVPDYKAVDAIAARHRRAGMVPITIGYYRYSAPRAGATADAAAADPVGVLEPHTAFYAAPLAHHAPGLLVAGPARHRGLHVRYLLPLDLVLTNLGDLPESVTIDFGDGLGPRTVALDTPIDVAYPSPGIKSMRLTATFGGKALQAGLALDIAPDSTMPPINETWTNLKGAWSYEGVTTTGHAWVFYGSGNTAITNPLLIAEGFPGGYSIEDLWDGLDTQGFASSLLASGMDLVICGFDDGTNYIEANAGVIATIIAQVLKGRQGQNLLFVGGTSMGGLVTRYALAYMQSQNQNPQTVLYFSFDSPHYGATVPLSVQWFCEVFANHSSYAQKAMEMLQSNAAQEMLLISLVDGTVSSPSQLRTQFINNLHTAGWYPTNMMLVGVSNGNFIGDGNGTPGGAQILTFAKDLNSINGQLYSAPGDAAQNNLIYHSQIVLQKVTELFPTFSQPPQLDSAPGGYSDAFLQLFQALSDYNPQLVANNATFIPIASALSMDISLYDQANLFLNLTTNLPASDLNMVYADTANNPHVTVTPGISSFLLGVIGDVRSVGG